MSELIKNEWIGQNIWKVGNIYMGKPLQNLMFSFKKFYWMVWFGFMVFNATFNNISAISWQSVLLVEETAGPRKNHRPVASHWQTLSHNVVHLALIDIRIHNISGNRTDCTGSCKSNCHTITATMTP
jgi:hypothetical protein